MESTALTTENLRNTMATVDAMRTANKELKRQYGKIDVDSIDVSGSFTVSNPTIPSFEWECGIYSTLNVGFARRDGGSHGACE